MFSCQRTGGICFETTRPLSDGGLLVTPVQFRPPLTLPIVLSGGVGQGALAANRFEDVIAVQRGFNQLLPDDRGFLAPLVEDGICGPKTRAGISQFQTKHFGIAGADGVMEPGRQSITKLNQLLQERPFVPLTIELLAQAMGLPVESVKGAFAASFESARAWIHAGFVRTLNPGRDALMEKYFQLTLQPNAGQAQQRVATIFGRLNAFFKRPGGLWGEQAFQPEPVIRATDTIAWCSPGGYLRPNQLVFFPVGPEEKLIPAREDTIYFTPRFVLTSGEERAYAIVHELCHFVSSSPLIKDHAYAHKQPAEFAALSPRLRLENTDHFAMLAYEAGTGQTTSPVRP